MKLLAFYILIDTLMFGLILWDKLKMIDDDDMLNVFRVF